MSKTDSVKPTTAVKEWAQLADTGLKEEVSSLSLMRGAGIVMRGFYKRFQSSIELDMSSFSFSKVKEVGFVILQAHIL